MFDVGPTMADEENSPDGDVVGKLDAVVDKLLLTFDVVLCIKPTAEVCWDLVCTLEWPPS